MKMKPGFVILFLLLSLIINAEQISVSINDFGFDLMRQIETEDNILISPYSVFTALAMTAEGADNKTLSQMRSTLHLDKDAEVAENMKKLQNYLTNLDDANIELNIANAIWIADGFKILKPFYHTIENDYLAEIHQADFLDQKNLLKDVNYWVADQTHDKIPEILQYLHPASKLILVNAVYFKAQWQEKFNARFTRKDIFHLDNFETTEADMMHLTKKFPYYEDDLLQALRMDYLDSDFSMIILLPKTISQLSDITKKLNDDYYQKINSNWDHGSSVIVTLPKFKIDFSRMLNDDLIVLGMPSAFADEADFSRISDMSDLSIGQVQHRGYIEVDEAGSEAAAATAVTMKMESARPPLDQHKFTADHPFIFLLQENTNNLVLFTGILKNPD